MRRFANHAVERESPQHHDTLRSTFSRGSRQFTRKPRLTWVLTILFVAVVAFFCLLKWGGYFLISEDPLPLHSDAAVALQGSFLGERARLAGAVDLLQQGAVDRILLSVPHESYWGQSIPPAVLNFIETTYGSQVADRVDFCESGPDVNSTKDEALILADCVRDRGWHSIVVVTSNYHTRRSGIIWRRTLGRQKQAVQLAIHGVNDEEFHPAVWWRERRSAKTCFFELTKLCSTLLKRS